MSQTKDIFLGYEIGTGNQVKVPVFHMLVTGQTQFSGKTTALKALAKQAAELGYKVLILDTKENKKDYETFGNPIPVCLEQNTDMLLLRDLLEAINDRKITTLQATLTELSEGTTTFEEVKARAEAMKDKTKSGFKHDACVTLADLMGRLIEQTKKVETTNVLELPHDINRMTLNDFELSGQQLIANTVFKQVLNNFKDVIIILDEASKFLPQMHGSPCKARVQEYVTQGAITGCFLWESTQFLATTSKDSMKAMPIKLLGRADHITEVEDVVELIPTAKSVTKGLYDKKYIMELKLGHFIVVTPKGVTTVYVCPDHADGQDCRAVALGALQPKDIGYIFAVEVETEESPTEEAPAEEVVETEQPRKSVQTILETGPTNEDFIKLTERVINMERVLSGEQDIDLIQIHRRVKLKTRTKKVSYDLQTAKGKILFLAHTDFFNDWKTSKEVMEELKQRNLKVEDGTVIQSLIRLAKDDYLLVRTETLLGSQKENYYLLSPNIVFEKLIEEKKENGDSGSNTNSS